MTKRDKRLFQFRLQSNAGGFLEFQRTSEVKKSENSPDHIKLARPGYCIKLKFDEPSKEGQEEREKESEIEKSIR